MKTINNAYAADLTELFNDASESQDLETTQVEAIGAAHGALLAAAEAFDAALASSNDPAYVYDAILGLNGVVNADILVNDPAEGTPLGFTLKSVRVGVCNLEDGDGYTINYTIGFEDSAFCAELGEVVGACFSLGTDRIETVTAWLAAEGFVFEG